MDTSETYAGDRSHFATVAMCRRCLRTVPPGKRCVCFAIDEIREHMARIDVMDENRKQIFDAVTEGHCTYCGKRGHCQCWNEE